MKVLLSTLVLSGLFFSDSLATCIEKTINPDASYEEESYPRRQQPKRNPKTTENEEEEFIRQDDTFVG